VSNSTTRAKIASFLRQDTGTILKISDHVDESTSRWKHCLVGIFLGYMMSYHAVNTIAEFGKTWP